MLKLGTGTKKVLPNSCQPASISLALRLNEEFFPAFALPVFLLKNDYLLLVRRPGLRQVFRSRSPGVNAVSVGSPFAFTKNWVGFSDALARAVTNVTCFEDSCVCSGHPYCVPEAVALSQVWREGSSIFLLFQSQPGASRSMHVLSFPRTDGVSIV